MFAQTPALSTGPFILRTWASGPATAEHHDSGFAERGTLPSGPSILSFPQASPRSGPQGGSVMRDLAWGDRDFLIITGYSQLQRLGQARVRFQGKTKFGQ